ncbi:hypothetical protein RIF29_39173 [Crotalaria pallida]|uniref:Uncharacterized protein n=1 Tax=Crotalaria pallida TaxID=3830 RepID=A0AAN9HT19_CROPI
MKGRINHVQTSWVALIAGHHLHEPSPSPSPILPLLSLLYPDILGFPLVVGVPECDMEVELSSMTKLTPGKHVLKGLCSKPSNHIEELVRSSNVRMRALFGNDDNSSVRRFAHDFDFNDDSSVILCDRQKSHYKQSSVLKCDSGKNSKRGLVIASVSPDFDINSNSVDYSSNDGNFDVGFHFEICEMDDANVRSTFEVGSSSRCQTQREACEGDDGFVMDNLEDVEEELLHGNHFCEDDDNFLG